MSDELTIKARDEEIEIKASRADYAAALIKGIIGAAPLVGPIVAETLSATISNQKLDRVITFIKIFEDRLNYLEDDVVKQKLKSEHFTDLLEDALHQASRAISRERKEYIANLLKNGLTEGALKHIESKRLLLLLDQLNDAEVILLKYISLEKGEEKTQMDKEYQFSWHRVAPSHVLQDELDRENFGVSYGRHLIQLGLIENDYERTSQLGNLLLRFIGLKEKPRDHPLAYRY